MNEERRAVLVDLPTSVRGFCCCGEDGEPIIVLNARLTHEQKMKTYEHERKHIENGEMFEPTYLEYS